MAAKMGVQAIVEMAAILFLLCCFNITLILMTEISSKSRMLCVRICRKAHANQSFTAFETPTNECVLFV